MELALVGLGVLVVLLGRRRAVSLIGWGLLLLVLAILAHAFYVGLTYSAAG